MEFIQGLKLCQDFFASEAEPLLRKHFPAMPYSAGLLGFGSDVLGFDDEVSTDHMWGPRFYLFLDKKDIHKKSEIMQLFRERLPLTFKGYSVHFSPLDPLDNGVRHAEFKTGGPVDPLIYIYTIEAFITEYLGLLPQDSIDWLVLAEHRLKGFTAGALFHDDLGLAKQRKALAYYPQDVKRYLVASLWNLIAEEQAFIGRCKMLGDYIGARVIASRITERLMRLCFLYCDTYAPYSKWLGTAFRNLPISMDIIGQLAYGLQVPTVEEVEACVVEAQRLVIGLHNESGLTEYFDNTPKPYFGRASMVFFVDGLAQLVAAKIEDPLLQGAPLIGSMSALGGMSALSDDPKLISRLRQLYMKLMWSEDFEHGL